MTNFKKDAGSGNVTPDGKTTAVHLPAHVVAPSVDAGLTSANSQQGKRFRRVNDALNTCGISHLIDTPKIAIMGSQSAGKSSVLTAISKIPFPRASGTCTRCSTEVRLYNKPQQWSCTMSLRIEYGKDDHPLPKTKVVKFGETLKDFQLVEQRIRAAQRAILNPSKDATSFLGSTTTEDTDEENEIGFSENTVCLDVCGNDLVDLTIIDIPGIIVNDDEVGNIELVKALVLKTIAKPNCFILSTITMSEDYQNQQGVMLAKEADPDGKRTLGVLTKPDRIDKGDFEQWVPLLKGEANRLHHGYFVVKNPSSEELKKKLTHQEIRALEVAYFQQEQWRSLGATVSARLGSQKLAQRLEILLEKLIQEKLPQTIAGIHKMSQTTDEKLRELPKKITAQQAKQKLFEVCQSFAHLFQKELDNKEIDEPVLFGWPLRVLSNTFCSKIYEEERSIDEAGKDLCELESETTGATIELSLKDAVPNDKLKSVSKVTAGAKLLTKPKVGPVRLTLSLVQDAIKSATETRLPGNVPFAVKEKLMKESVKHFSAIALDFFDDVTALLKRTAKVLVSKHLNASYESRLPQAILNSVSLQIDSQAESCRKLVEQIIHAETVFVFTLNDHYYVDKRDQFVKRLCKRRLDEGLHGDKVKGPFSDKCDNDSVVDFLKEQNFPINDLSDLAESRIPVEMKERIMLASEVRAYWQVAFKRFVDNICAIVHVHLIKPVAGQCFAKLCEDLGLLGDVSSDEASRLLQHTESIRHQREDLETTKGRLDNALKVIEDFHRGLFD